MHRHHILPSILNDKEHGYAVFVNENATQSVTNSFFITYFNGTTNTWETPYDVMTVKNALSDFAFNVSFSNNPSSTNEYGINVIYAGSLYGSRNKYTNIFSASSFGEGRAFIASGVTIPQNVALTSVCAINPTPNNEEYLTNPTWIEPAKKSFSWTAPSNASEYTSISIVKTTVNPDVDQFNSASPFIIATGLPTTTTSFVDKNQPSSTVQFYKVYYVKTGDPTKAYGTQTIAINCSA